MKRIVSVILLLSTALFCFAEDYYESNILGMKLKQLESPETAGTDYILTIKIDDVGNEIRFLDKDRIRVSKTELFREGARLTEQTEEADRSIRVVRENGIIVSEFTERSDGSSELIDYSYTGRRLISTAVSIDGERAYSDSYYYTDSGRLLDVERNYSSSPDKLSLSFIFDNGRISSFWMNSEDRGNYIRFDSEGIVLNEIFGSDGWNETREYSRLSDGRQVELIRNIDDGTSVTLTYDAENRLLDSLSRDSEGRILVESEWQYKSGRLISYKIRKELSLELFIFEWSGEGTLVKETYYKNGNIIQLTEYQDEDDFTELLYRNGTAVLKIIYADGERIGTVQLQEN
ncbi:MAG TPA: hypothetical protein DCO79_01355 [Spirochaeta sp.]|nr:hypothetical protein [Spirochaeta sp.]